MSDNIIPVEIIENRIFIIRGQKVMIDRDLAELYEVKTFILNQAVKRNMKRFPDEFMFKLNDDEKKELITNCDRFQTLKYSTSNPYAFTEHGVVMLANILNSDRAINVNVQIVKTFIKLREIALTQKDVFNKLNELERRFITYAQENTAELSEQEQKINDIFKQLQYLHEKVKPSQIGFKSSD